MQQASNASDEVETLLTVAEDLVPLRNEDVPSTVSIHFDGLLNPPLTLKQDMKEGCGGKTWPAGMVLAEYLLRCKLDSLEDKTMSVSSKSTMLNQRLLWKCFLMCFVI